MAEAGQEVPQLKQQHRAVRNLDSGEITGIIESSDETLLQQALETYHHAVDAADAARKGERTVVVWTAAEGIGWKQVLKQEE